MRFRWLPRLINPFIPKNKAARLSETSEQACSYAWCNNSTVLETGASCTKNAVTGTDDLQQADCFYSQ